MLAHYYRQWCEVPKNQRILEKYEGNTTRLQKLFSARLKHDSSYASHGVLRPRMTHPKSPREAPGAVHPLFIRVEEYGDTQLFFREDERMHFYSHCCQISMINRMKKL